MKPVDYSVATFRDLQGRLIALRLSVWEAMLDHGPDTTRGIARACNMDILTVRPRVTELVQLGFAVLVEDGDEPQGHEGTYRALTTAEAEAAFKSRQASAQESQLQFTI